jgi:hypothetical protein
MIVFYFAVRGTIEEGINPEYKYWARFNLDDA